MLKCSWPSRASQVYLYFSAVTPPTILVTGPFTPQVFSPGWLGEAEQDCKISPLLFLSRNTRLAQVGLRGPRGPASPEVQRDLGLCEEVGGTAGDGAFET